MGGPPGLLGIDFASQDELATIAQTHGAIRRRDEIGAALADIFHRTGNSFSISKDRQHRGDTALHTVADRKSVV